MRGGGAGSEAVGDGAGGGGEAGVRGGGEEPVPVRAVHGAAPLLRPQQRRGRRPAGHPPARRRALRAPRRPKDPRRRARAVQVRLDDALRLPAPQLTGPLLALNQEVAADATNRTKEDLHEAPREEQNEAWNHYYILCVFLPNWAIKHGLQHSLSIDLQDIRKIALRHCDMSFLDSAITMNHCERLGLSNWRSWIAIINFKLEGLIHMRRG